MSNARKVAVNALMRVEKEGAYSNLVLNEMIKSASLDKMDASFVTVLFYGVLERKVTLDYFISKLSKQPFGKISPLTLQVLRIGLYQILYMDKIPDSAAVNESVKIINKSKERHCAGFVNALLRNALRCDLQLPKEKTALSLSVNYSCGLSLAEKLISQYGYEVSESFLAASLEKTPLYVRVNTLMTDVNELSALLKEQGVTASEAFVPSALCIEDSGSIEANSLFKKGYFHVQDISSQICAGKLGAQKGERVLDICAAPGGKTFTICEAMQNAGEVISCDLHPHRVKLIADGAKRLGINIVKTAVSDATVQNPEFLEGFDRVLCDVPCSGSGIIGRKPDIKYKDFSSVSELNEIQSVILENGFKYLKKGGTLVYSTCSVLFEENENIVNKFLLNNPSAKLTFKHTFLPNVDKTDGFFVAVIEK